MIKLEQLRYLLELNKTDSFRECAERLQCSQPAVSLAIKNLEKELGVTLITRTGSSIQLTPIGEEVAKQAKAIWANVADLYLLANEEKIERAQLDAPAPIKDIAFYATETTLSTILPMVLLRLQKQSLSLKLSTVEAYPLDTVHAVLANENAIGLHYFWEDECSRLQESFPELRLDPLCELKYYLVVSNDATFDIPSAIDLDDPSPQTPAFPLVMYGRSGNTTWDVMEILADKHHADLVFKAPEDKMFYNYIGQGFAAGLIMQYGETKPLKRHKDRDRFHFIPLSTARRGYFCCLAQRTIHPELYRRLLEYVQFSVDFL